MPTLSREQEEGVLSEHYDSGKDCDIVEDKWLSNCLWILCQDVAKPCWKVSKNKVILDMKKRSLLKDCERVFDGISHRQVQRQELKSKQSRIGSEQAFEQQNPSELLWVWLHLSSSWEL